MGKKNHVSESELIGRIYDAALEPALWEEVLHSLIRYLGAQSSYFGSLNSTPPHARNPKFFATYSLTHQNVIDYLDYYYKKDPGYLYKLDKPVGIVTTRSQHMRDSEFIETEYYRDFGRHLAADVFYQAGMFVKRRDDFNVTIAVQRAKSREPFSAHDLRKFANLHPHLQRAFRISSMLEESRETLATHYEILQSLGHGVILLNELGQPVFLNTRAETMLRNTDCLFISQNRLTASDPLCHQHLDALIQQSVRRDWGGNSGTGGELMTSPRPGSAPIKLFVLPLHGQHVDSVFPGKSVHAAVIVQSPVTNQNTNPQLLRSLFALTPKEIEVALAMAKGKNTREIAEQFHTSLETVRSQIKSITAKMGVRSQSEVILQVLALSGLEGTPIAN